MPALCAVCAKTGRAPRRITEAAIRTRDMLTRVIVMTFLSMVTYAVASVGLPEHAVDIQG
jgi:hypothetical protein